MSDLPRVCTEQIRKWTDPNSYSKAEALWKKGQVRDMYCTDQSIGATVAGTTDYRISIHVAEKEPKPHCSCPAYRRNKFCKHVCAVLLAWSDNQDQFTRTEALDVGFIKEEFRGKRQKKETVSKEALLADGLRSVDRLISEFVVRGLLNVTTETRLAVTELADFARAHKLRHIGNRLTELSAVLQSGAEGSEFAEILTDLWGTVRAVQGHLAGRLPNDSQMAELIGKTWRDTELESVQDLTLMELAYREESTIAGFKVQTSVFCEPLVGHWFEETAITPAKLRGVESKPSYSEIVRVQRGSLYPGEAPRRLKIQEMTTTPWRREHVEAILDQRVQSIAQFGEVLRQDSSGMFSENRKYVLFQPDHAVEENEHIWLVDDSGKSIPVLQGHRGKLKSWLRGHPLNWALVGEIKWVVGEIGFVPLAALASECPHDSSLAVQLPLSRFPQRGVG